LQILAAPGEGTGLVRPAPGSDFEITTLLQFEPTRNFQFAGLVVGEGTTDYLQLGRAYCDVPLTCVGDGIYFDSVVAGVFTGSNYSVPLSTPAGIHLRVRAEGSTFTAYYSSNGIDWIPVGSHLRSFGAPHIGLVAHQSDVDVVAEFDYFRVSVSE
jgi:beta-xylosidase